VERDIARRGSPLLGVDDKSKKAACGNAAGSFLTRLELHRKE